MAKLCEACGTANARGRSSLCRYCAVQLRAPIEAPVEAAGIDDGPDARWSNAFKVLRVIVPLIAVLLAAASGSH
jgi:hypothetical protein